MGADGTRSILLVEDDSFFALRISEFLSDNGLDVCHVRSASEALKKNLGDYVAAIVDVMLPNDPDSSGIAHEESRGGYLSGVAVARRFRRRDPSFPLVLLSSAIAGGEARAWAREHDLPFVSKLEHHSRLLSVLSELGLAPDVPRPRSFIVHGHDNELLLELKDYLHSTLRWPEPVILREQASGGKTIIEKFEEHAGLVDWVFVLLSPDDAAFRPKSNDERRRARQNVIFELGFFYGLIGRHEGRILALKKGVVEIPSDISGVTWVDVSNGILAAGERLRQELGR